MTPKDRDYFMLRAGQEREAAARSHGAARGRHEELASAYRMRVIYFDKGLADEASAEAEPSGAEPIQHIIVAA